MGGTIDVLTAPGSGTQIVIRLKFRLADEKDVDTGEREAAEHTLEIRVTEEGRKFTVTAVGLQ